MQNILSHTTFFGTNEISIKKIVKPKANCVKVNLRIKKKNAENLTPSITSASPAFLQRTTECGSVCVDVCGACRIGIV